MMYSMKKKLLRWGAVYGVIAFCGMTWCIAGIAPEPIAGGLALKRTVTTQTSAEPTLLHDEVQYFSDKAAEQSRAL